MKIAIENGKATLSGISAETLRTILRMEWRILATGRTGSVTVRGG